MSVHLKNALKHHTDSKSVNKSGHSALKVKNLKRQLMLYMVRERSVKVLNCPKCAFAFNVIPCHQNEIDVLVPMPSLP